MNKKTIAVSALIAILIADNVRIGRYNIKLKQHYLDLLAHDNELVTKYNVLVDKYKVLAGAIRVEDAEKVYVDLEFIDLTHGQ